MPDRKMVLQGLECVIRKMEGGVHVCDDCPYDEDFNCLGCTIVLWQAIALLNGQTAQWIWDRPHHFRCSGCNGVVGQRTYLYCPNCGREMLLSETERRKEWPEEVSGDA